MRQEASAWTRSSPSSLEQVDGTQEPDLNQRFGVQGFPTLKLIYENRVYEHTGSRAAPALVEFAKVRCRAIDDDADDDAFSTMTRRCFVAFSFGVRQGGFKSVAGEPLPTAAVARRAAAAPAEEEAVPTGPSHVIALTESTFEHDTQASTGATTGRWFVKFYAPWCAHCKRLTPVWERLATELQGSGVNVAKVDATAEKALSRRFKITSFPTLRYFANGKMYSYTGERTFEAMYKFAVESFADAPATPVPQPPTFWNLVQDEVEVLTKDFHQMATFKKNISLIIFAVGFAVGVLFMMVLTTLSDSRPKNPGNPAPTPRAAATPATPRKEETKKEEVEEVTEAKVQPADVASSGKKGKSSEARQRTKAPRE